MLNKFVSKGLIPLGINTWKGNRENKSGIVCIPRKKNGSIVIIGTSGWGKSVLLKRLIDYELGLYSGKKAGLIIDTQGVDHRLLKYPNDRPFLFRRYGEVASGLKNIRTYCPVFASKKAREEDKIYGISINDLDPYDLRSSNLNDSSVIEFFKIKQMSQNNREIMKNPQRFYVEFSKLKASKQSTEQSDLDYPEGSLVHYGIKEALLRNFMWWAGYQPEDDEKPEWMSEEQWTLRKRPPYFVDFKGKNYKPTFWKEYDKKTIVVNCFMDAKEEREGMSIYGGYCLRDAYDYCNIRKEKNPKFDGMFICVEEANLFIDGDDKYLKKGSNFYLTELLCRGFKFEVFIIVNFQSIHNSNSDIREYLTSGSNPVIIGNLTNKDREYLGDIFPSIKHLELRDNVPNLNWGGKEWAIYYNDREFDTFVPYPSLSRFHKRGK